MQEKIDNSVIASRKTFIFGGNLETTRGVFLREERSGWEIRIIGEHAPRVRNNIDIDGETDSTPIEYHG